MERIERRETGNVRIPLTGIPVELGDDELPGGFEADARDLGVGGVGLRSAFLPKIGSRLHCRFRNPEDGTPIEARGEVVWADETGPYEGAFGLRFEALDGRSAGELDRLIGEVATIDRRGEEAAMRDEEGEAALAECAAPETIAEELPEGLPEEGEAALAECASPEVIAEELPEGLPEESEPELVQLELDGVAQALTAELVHASEDAVVLEQALDFLTLERRVSLEGGRRGVVASVDLRIDGETPKLVMTLTMEGGATAVSARAEAPFERGHEPHPEASPAARADEVRPEDGLPAAPESVGARSVESADVRGGHAVMARPPEPAPAAGAEPIAARPAEPAPSPLEPVAPVADAEPVTAWVDRPSERPAPEKGPAEVLREGVERIGPFLAKLRALVVAFVERARPVIERALTLARARGSEWAGRFFSSTKGAASRGAQRVRRFGGALPRNFAAQRSDVRLPARRPQRRQTVPQVPLEARSRSRTQLVIGIGVVFALLFGVGLLVMGDEVESDAPETEEIAPASEAASVEATGKAFGAGDLPGAMIFDLVLESAASRLEGRVIEDGILVRIPGGRAVSRAGAIAANHPDVEYAAIRNLDGAAELELRFVPGREPMHRVELRGSIVRVSLMP